MFTFVFRDFAQNLEFLSFVFFHIYKTELKISQERLFRLGWFFDTRFISPLCSKWAMELAKKFKKKSYDIFTFSTRRSFFQKLKFLIFQWKIPWLIFTSLHQDNTQSSHLALINKIVECNIFSLWRCTFYKEYTNLTSAEYCLNIV